MNKVIIAPSILSADFSDMGNEIRRIEKAGADWIHCDVMDGKFVPNITFGPKMIKDIRKVTGLTLDVHLMIDEPINYVEKFAAAGADYITFHIEATKKVKETLEYIKSLGVKCGIVVKPQTPIGDLAPFLPISDMALLMSVNPGFGGQKYIEGSTQRLKELVKLRNELNKNCLVEIDGGITLANVDEVKDAGVQVIVAGSAVFGSSDPAAAIERMKA